MFCQNCGNRLEEKDNFCSNCGKVQKEETCKTTSIIAIFFRIIGGLIFAYGLFLFMKGILGIIG